MTVLERHIPEIKKLCSNYSVKSLYAFGSVLTNKFTAKSDIDLIVDFENVQLEEYADNYFDFKFALQSVLNRQVDLLEEQAIKNPYFKKNISEHKQLIYGH